MNGRQVALVLLGMLVFLFGAYLGLTPVDGPLPVDGPASRLPFVDPYEAFAVRPERVLLAVGVTLAGVVVAVLGCLVFADDEPRPRRRTRGQARRLEQARVRRG